MKYISTLLILFLESGHTCLSTENPSETTTTTINPKTCYSCDLTALYSNTFCPSGTGCEYNYPLMEAAQVVSSTMPPCIEVRNICPKDAYIGVDLGDQQVNFPSSDYESTLSIECNQAGQWIANIVDSGLHNIDKLTCFLKKSCSTCDNDAITFDPTLCLENEAISPTINIVFDDVTKCNTIDLSCMGNSMPVLGLKSGLASPLDGNGLSINCINGEFVYSTTTPNLSGAFDRSACCSQIR